MRKTVRETVTSLALILIGLTGTTTQKTMRRGLMFWMRRIVHRQLIATHIKHWQKR